MPLPADKSITIRAELFQGLDFGLQAILSYKEFGFLDVGFRLGIARRVYQKRGNAAINVVEHEQAKDEQERLLALPTSAGETILVVEDDILVRKALVESLEFLDYRTLEATNGREALATLEQHGDDVDLILSDVIMPGMDGRALLRALREMALAIPVVMLTGHSTEEEVEELQGLGIADCLFKPLGLEDLVQVVDRVLGADRRGRRHQTSGGDAHKPDDRP